MSIEAVVARIDDSVGEPLMHLVGFGMSLQSIFEGGRSMPIELGRSAEPIAAAVAKGLVVFLLIAAEAARCIFSGGKVAIGSMILRLWDSR